jgi:hypothetical protein
VRDSFRRELGPLPWVTGREDGVEISIEGTDSFELDLPKSIGRVRINGYHFMLRSGQHHLRFGYNKCQWRLEPEST